MSSAIESRHWKAELTKTDILIKKSMSRNPPRWTSAQIDQILIKIITSFFILRKLADDGKFTDGFKNKNTRSY